jgi:alpha-L-fucosidase
MPASTTRKGIASILAPLVAGLSFWLPPAARAADRAWGGGEGVWTDASAKGWNGTPPAKGDRAIIRSGSVAATANNQQEGVALTVSGPAVFRSAGFYLTPARMDFSSGGSVRLENTEHYHNYGGGRLPAMIAVTGSSSSGSRIDGDAGHAFWNLADGTIFDVADVTGDSKADLTVSAGLMDAVGTPDTTWVASGIVKTGAGTLRLGAANTYTGVTEVKSGLLSLGSAGSLGGGEVRISSGAKMHLDYNGSVPVEGLFLDGVAQPGGVYGAATHPAYFTGAGQLVVPPPFRNALADAPNDGMSNFRRMKYGLFVHYAWGGSAHKVTVNPDGSLPTGIDDLADRFDAPGFAGDLERMQVEYVIFTAWHANINCLWPSAAMNRWLSGHTSKRDLLGDMIDAVRAKGIRVILYTHPRDGHDLSLPDQVATGWGGPGEPAYPDWTRFNFKKWNDFLNDLYGDLLSRYGDRIDGLWLDQGTAVPDDERIVDYQRLWQTIKGRRPGLIMIQNFYGDLNTCDIGQVEYWGGPFARPSAGWPTDSKPLAVVMGSSWSAARPAGANTVPFHPEDMFRYNVLQAGVNTDGGGVSWASGPYAGGGWETGVLAAMKKVGRYIQPIRRSICNTLPSRSWITPAGTTLGTLPGGFVATRSPDDGSEFIHVLNPPAVTSITLPAPADKRAYASASLLAGGNPVTMTTNPDLSLTLTLPPGHAWNPLDSVIVLTPAAGHMERQR